MHTNLPFATSLSKGFSGADRGGERPQRDLAHLRNSELNDASVSAPIQLTGYHRFRLYFNYAPIMPRIGSRPRWMPFAKSRCLFECVRHL